MTRYYNHRNSRGQFTRRVARAKNGKFTSPFQIVAGRLYDYRGATVRALKKDTVTGARLVSFHKTLFGFVKDAELDKINRRKVETYLASA